MKTYFKKRDLHPGNVLLSKACFIADLGLSVLESEAKDIKDIVGVMPYLAPELLSRRSSYSQQTDVYAFGMIMWEIGSGERPFHDTDHDHILALQICQGHRPEITEDTPQVYRDLMEKCWHADPTKRPTATEIVNLTKNWRHDVTPEMKELMKKADVIRKQDVRIKKEIPSPHTGAIYTSRILTDITNGKQALIIFNINIII